MFKFGALVPPTATAVSGAATLKGQKGKVTSEALTTAAASNYTLTITNSEVSASNMALASVAYGTTTQGTPVVSRVTCGSGTITVVVKNDHATDAFNGTIVVSFAVL
jgi:hypothetical protein